LSENLIDEGILYNTYNKERKQTNGYLEDYAFVIEAFLTLYENTFDESWLFQAEALAKTAFRDFYDESKGYFYFTSNQDQALVSRTMELQDNVIPSSNSAMAKNLFKLSRYFGNMEYEDISKKMVLGILLQIEKYPQAYSNWLDLALNLEMDFYEIAIVGKNCFKLKKELDAYYIPNKIMAGSIGKSSIPLLSGRYEKGKTLIYVCKGGSCQMPVESVEEALKLI
jgi:uncharacterized protein YyaL (SSP411 family)